MSTSRDPAARSCRKENESGPTTTGEQTHSEKVQTRLAALIALGEAPFPEGLDPHQEEQLLAAVRALRRDQLRKLIARQIALTISRDAVQRQGG